jgi:hemoglobin
MVEYIRYSIDDARAEAFEQAYSRAADSLDDSEHCERYEVSRCTEDPTQHVDRIEWDSEEGHLSASARARNSAASSRRSAPFVHDIDEMRHYQAMLSSKA